MRTPKLVCFLCPLLIVCEGSPFDDCVSSSGSLVTPDHRRCFARSPIDRRWFEGAFADCGRAGGALFRIHNSIEWTQFKGWMGTIGSKIWISFQRFGANFATDKSQVSWVKARSQAIPNATFQQTFDPVNWGVSQLYSGTSNCPFLYPARGGKIYWSNKCHRPTSSTKLRVVCEYYNTSPSPSKWTGKPGKKLYLLPMETHVNQTPLQCVHLCFKSSRCQSVNLIPQGGQCQILQKLRVDCLPSEYVDDTASTHYQPEIYA